MKPTGHVIPGSSRPGTIPGSFAVAISCCATSDLERRSRWRLGHFDDFDSRHDLEDEGPGRGLPLKNKVVIFDPITLVYR